MEIMITVFKRNFKCLTILYVFYVFFRFVMPNYNCFTISSTSFSIDSYIPVISKNRITLSLLFRMSSLKSHHSATVSNSCDFKVDKRPIAFRFEF